MGAGLALQWSLLAACAAGGLALTVFTLAWRLRTHATWSVSTSPERIPRGSTLSAQVEVTLERGSARWLSVVGEGGERVGLTETDQGRATLLWHVDTRRRGPQPDGPTRLEFADPFGLVHRVLGNRAAGTILVVPRVHDIRRGVASKRSDPQAPNEFLGAEALQALREYTPGDDTRLIHWRASARAGKLIVRRLVETRTPRMLVVLDVNERAFDRSGDLFAELDPALFEAAVDQAASQAWFGCGSQQHVVLATTAKRNSRVWRQPLEVGPSKRVKILDALATVTTVLEDDCDDSAIATLLHQQSFTHAVFVTGPHPRTSSQWISRWRRHCTLSVLRNAQ